MNHTGTERLILGAIGAILCLAPVRVAAQQGDLAAIRVRVIDASTRTPIYGAQVGFPDLRLFTLTDKAGFAQIRNVPPGERSLEVTMLGYGTASAAMTLEAHAVATGDIGLKTEPIHIDGITVLGTAEIARLRDQGFYQRRKTFPGHFLGPLEISKKFAIQPTDLFRGMASVHLVPTSFGRNAIYSHRSCQTFVSSFGGGANARSNGGASADLDGSALRVYLDGVPYGDGLDYLPLEMIQAIEVYVGSETPVQYTMTGGMGGGSATCGVILIWSK